MTPSDAERRLSILSVSPSVAGGGAEKVALDLHHEYLKRGMSSVLAVGDCNAEEPGTMLIPRDSYRGPWVDLLLPFARTVDLRSHKPTDAAWIASRGLRLLAEPRRVVRVGTGHEDFDFPQTKHLLELVSPPPDVLHLHNLHGAYFDIRALPDLSAAVPTFMTLHDMWILTGHCAHSFDCERWRAGCGDCPDLGRYVPIRGDRSAANYAVKHDALRRSRLRIAAPSAWLARLVEAGNVLADDSELRVVPNGVDTDVFTPGDRAEARAALGLSAERPIALIAARALRGSPYKGFGTLSAALGIIAKSGRADDLLLVGLGEDSAESSIEGVETRFVPFVDDPDQMARYYRAADLYVHPARAENLPLAIIESMACGTPVVASNVGGIPEIVVDGETGMLVEAEDPAALASAVLSSLDDSDRIAAFSRAGVQRVLECFTLNTQVETYVDWYREAVEES
jgi:glycosyltransferase involved in cell wall biosynthesis